MRIYLVSDLHVEFCGDFPLPNPQADIGLVVLAGDIHKGEKVMEVASAYQRHYRVPVIVVAGNHEFYGGEYESRLAALRHEASLLRDVHFLENDVVVINKVRFLGCTLWSDFSLFGEDQVALAKGTAVRSISDFSVIRWGHQRFTPDHAAALFRKSYAWLEAELSKEFLGPTVVVSHFLPHRAGVHPMHLKEDQLTPYFTVDCSELMRRFCITAWLCGHTHNSIELSVENGTRLVSNQRGYPREPWHYTEFDSGKIVDTCHNAFHNRYLQREAAQRKYLRRLILTSGDWQPAIDIVRAARPRANAAKANFPKWVAEGRLVSIRHQGTTLYPRYAFDLPNSCEPLPILAEVIAAFGTAEDAWKIAAWLHTPNHRLSLSEPKYCLVTRQNEVRVAANEREEF